MSAIDNTPSNKNFLSPLNFRFNIKKAPHVNFFIQRVNIPSIELPSPVAPSEFVKVPYPGEHINYGDLDISFKVDEDLQNYLELHTWLRGLSDTKDYIERAALDAIPNYTGDGTTFDISLIILNSAKNPNYQVVFQDAFPTELGDVVFDSTDSDINYVTCEAKFKYTLYEISRFV